MTDEERWATEARPDAVISHVKWRGWKPSMGRTLLTGRETRLFACGCFRLIWDRITLPSIRERVELAEARADRAVKQEVLDRNRHADGNPPPDTPDYLLRLYVTSLLGTRVVPGHLARVVRHAAEPERYPHDGQWQECSHQANLARCVFGNPFRPVAFDPDWRTPAAVALARGMYEARDFAHMPILADALQDAGCEEPAVIGHCRDPDQPHVRGCWLVEAVLAPAVN